MSFRDLNLLDKWYWISGSQMCDVFLAVSPQRYSTPIQHVTTSSYQLSMQVHDCSPTSRSTHAVTVTIPALPFCVQHAVVKVQQCEVGGALLTLPLDFSHICQALKKGDKGLASLAALVQVRCLPSFHASAEGGGGGRARVFCSPFFEQVLREL